MLLITTRPDRICEAGRAQATTKSRANEARDQDCRLYCLTGAEVAASSMSLAVSFG